MEKNDSFSGFMGGEANFLGFKIKDVWGSSARSKHYALGKTLMLLLEITLAATFCGFYAFLIYIGIMTVYWLLIFIPVTGIFVYLRTFKRVWQEIIRRMPIIGDDLKEWHAVEHKLGNMIDGHHKYTLANLRKASSLKRRCGIDNQDIKEPSESKLEEAMRVCKKLYPYSPSFFEPKN
jgi:hypothetical protein